MTISFFSGRDSFISMDSSVHIRSTENSLFPSAPLARKFEPLLTSFFGSIMIFLYLALIPLSFTTKSSFEDFEGSASGSSPSANFLGDSLSPDPFIDDVAPLAFVTSNEEALGSSDSADSGDLFTISPDLDDSSASPPFSSPSIFDNAEFSSELIVGPSAGDSGLASSDIHQSSDLMNLIIASSELNLIAQEATGPGVAMEHDATQFVGPTDLAFPELQQSLRELFRINAQGSRQSCPAAWLQRPECPPGKFPFCCLDGPPRAPSKRDRRGFCSPCGLLLFFFLSVFFLGKNRHVGYCRQSVG